MRIAILTSVDTRHRYFVQALREAFDVCAVGYERTGYSPATVIGMGLTGEEAKIVTRHFAERTRQEEIYFGHRAELVDDGPGCAVRHIEPGGLNAPETQAFLAAARPDVVVVYGTNLIRQPLLGAYAGRMLNMHLGLSPYYRGTATNFYPLLNEEPQYVGATIHLIDAGIDSGPIVYHARPEIVPGDMPHTIGCKAILAGIEAMAAALSDAAQGRLSPVPQWPAPGGGRLYLRKDYHPRQVVELYTKLDAGMIPRYALRAAELAGAVRVIAPLPAAAGVVRLATAQPG
jgi:hypothetical protein